MRYSLAAWLVVVGTVLFTQGDRLVVGAVLGTATLGVYAVITSTVLQINSLSATAVLPILPEISSEPLAPSARDAVATKGLDASVGDLIETKLGEREAKRRGEQAQQRRDWQARMEERELKKLIETLQLNDETKEKMKGILAQSREDIREFFVRLRNEGNIDRDKIREGMQKISNEADNAVKKILSEEQFKKYQEVQTQTRRRWGNIGGGRRH